MNVLFLSDFEITPISGGVEKIVHVLTTNFRSDGMRCFLAYFQENKVGSRTEFDDYLFLEDGAKFSLIEDFIVRNRVDVIITAMSQKRHYMVYMPQLYVITRPLGVKVIYGYYVMPGADARGVMDCSLAFHRIKNGEDKKAVLSQLFITWCNRLGLNPLLNKLLKKKLSIARFADMVVVLSDAYIAKYKSLISNVIDVPFVAIPNPLMVDNNADNSSLENKEHLVINVSRFDVVHKRQNDLIDIWKIVEKNKALSDWRLILVGYGQDEKYLHDYAIKKGVKRVEFLKAQDITLLSKKASIYASTSAFEGLPMVIVEAMQCGVVPVSVDSFDAVYDIIDDDKNGSIVRFGNKKEFAQKLSALMSDDNRRKKMALASIEKSKNFDLDTVLAKWKSTINQICNDN